MDTPPPRSPRRRRIRKRFSSSPFTYLPFGKKSTTILLLFTLIYLTFLICFIPMIYDYENGDYEEDDYYVDRIREKNARLHDAMAHVRHPHLLSKDEIHDVVGNMKQKGKNIMKKEKEIAGRMEQRARRGVNKVKERAKRGVQKVFSYLSKGEAQIESELLKDAFEEFEAGRVVGEQVSGVIVERQARGFVVLGMHRSGTSMLAGLLVQGFGYNVGEPLIAANYDNKKGFFELVPAVLQNDEFLKDQGADWSSNIRKYNVTKALDQWKTDAIDKQEGQKALNILRSDEMVPWLQKDPRMCITLQTWLPLLAENDGGPPPAVVFTYRHPLEVAMSLRKRQGFTLYVGFRLWIIYNQIGVQNSQNLCRVQTSNTAVLADPMKETSRIVAELTERCHVVKAPVDVMPQKVVNDFVDPKLQGDRKKEEEKREDIKVLERMNGGACLVKEYESEQKEGTAFYKQERAMYLNAMKVYCDFESGKAYNLEYEWPSFD